MGLFKILGFGSKRNIDKRTEEKIIETGTRILAEHDAIMRGERSIFEDHDLTEEETLFFKELSRAMSASGFNPSYLKLRRLSSRTFNVNYAPLCYIGKINLSPISDPDKYAVIKPGQKRALRVFDTEVDAQEYQATHAGTEMQFRPGKYKGENFMQCLVGEDKIIRMGNPSLQECIAAIPKWIAYLKYCKSILK